jgi:hypothetical protein
MQNILNIGALGASAYRSLTTPTLRHRANSREIYKSRAGSIAAVLSTQSWVDQRIQIGLLELRILEDVTFTEMQ